MEERAIPRQGMAIEGGGEVTSGSHSPLLERGIGLGYVPSDQAQPGSELTIDVRGKPRRARVVRKPIYNKEEDGASGGD
jgi:aminomethyltransferase